VAVWLHVSLSVHRHKLDFNFQLFVLYTDVTRSLILYLVLYKSCLFSGLRLRCSLKIIVKLFFQSFPSPDPTVEANKEQLESGKENSWNDSDLDQLCDIEMSVCYNQVPSIKCLSNSLPCQHTWGCFMLLPMFIPSTGWPWALLFLLFPTFWSRALLFPTF